MDYRVKYLLSLVMIMCLNSSVHSTCAITDKTNGCVYTVLCEIYAGSINSPGCSSTPNVTFIIKNAQTNSLTTGFFSNTNFDSRVRTFIAIDNQFQYIEMKALRYYRYSTIVDLSQNNNIQIIETGAFLELTAMRLLNLSHNIISDLYNGTLQVSSELTSALEVLDLSYNHLVSLDSYVFKYCLNLQELYLQNNRIKTLSDKCFNNLENLKRLNLNQNYISSLNMTLVLLPELTYLDISHNNILKLYGLEMPRFGSLIYVNISYNSMESVNHSTFILLSKLEELDLSHNQINSSLGMIMFANNHNLNYLNFYQNNITTLTPSVFLNNNNLHYINLEKNKITGNISSDTFRGLSNITDLKITHQQINIIQNNAFSEMIMLQNLNISNNLINEIENSSFVNVSTLEVIDISYNQIETLYFLKMLFSNLSEIYINNNKLTIIPKGVFDNYSSLKKLDISENMIVRIDQNSLPLSKLQFLGIHHNNLSGIVKANIFSPAKYLRNLDLSNFRLQKLNESALVDIPLAARGNLSHNNLDFIHPSNFKGVDNMYSLDISYNNLTNLVIETPIQNLKATYLSNNRLTGIPDIFGNQSKLEYLDISHNNISNITNAALKNVCQLKVLHLSFNHLTTFNNQFTNMLIKLTELSLANNNIKEMINMSYYHDLESVNLSNNEISFINSFQLQSMPALRLLSLSGNKLKLLEPGTFQNLQSLYLVDLSSNNLSKIRFGSFRGLNNTKIINLSQNKIQTLNSEVFHECPELKTLIIDNNYVKSIDIKKLLMAAPKLETLSIGGNPIACEEIVQSKRTIRVLMLQVTMTSVHKVFHEDNVHGIKCGDDNTDDTVESTSAKVLEAADVINGTSTVTVLLIWWIVLSLVAIIGMILLYLYKRNGKRLNINRASRVQLRNSGEMSHSECYGDLLN